MRSAQVHKCLLKAFDLKEKLESNYSVDFVERLPLFVRHTEEFRRLDRPLHLARPHFQILDFLLLDELLQMFGKLEGTRP